MALIVFLKYPPGLNKLFHNLFILIHFGQWFCNIRHLLIIKNINYFLYLTSLYLILIDHFP
jgi:hypothetical protein